MPFILRFVNHGSRHHSPRNITHVGVCPVAGRYRSRTSRIFKRMDVIDVTVLDVDEKKGRISLTMIDGNEKRSR